MSTRRPPTPSIPPTTPPTARPLPPADPYPDSWDAEDEPLPPRKHPSDVHDRGMLDALGLAVLAPVIEAGRPTTPQKESEPCPATDAQHPRPPRA